MSLLRETLCNNCMHRDVCGHKDTYNKTVHSLESIFNEQPEGEREFMALNYPSCKFYKKEAVINPIPSVRNMNPDEFNAALKRNCCDGEVKP